MVTVKIVMDERISDGFYAARSLDVLKGYFANPAELVKSLKQTTEHTEGTEK
jgi:hypothetical protein